jgi:rubrerythrin
MKLTLDEEVAFTKAWWENLIKDEARTAAWLKKLYGTELGGYDDYQGFLAKFKHEATDRTVKILSNIADDELKHSKVIIDVLAGRGHQLDPNPPQSTYWQTMDSHIVDLTTACAANYYGEALAAFRFEVIAEHKDTPTDIREMLSIVLPDEQFHRETLKRLAGADILEQFREIHENAVIQLKGTK